MITATMRLLLIAGSLLTIAFMLFRIRAAQVSIRDSIYWIVFSFMLLVISLVPELATWIAQLLGVESPINFVYLFIIFVLLIKIFSSSLRISLLDTKVQQLTQRIALNEKKHEEQSKK